MTDQPPPPALAAASRDYQGLARILAPYGLAAVVVLAAAARPDMTEAAKTVITLVLGAALTAIDPNPRGGQA